ncbi:MAG: prefoldin subunit alpha [Candidatus Micrarchaeota archaeon]
MSGSDPQKIAYEARLYSEQLKLIESEINRISITLVELRGSLDVVEAINETTDKTINGNLIFVPIGGGSMVSAKIISPGVIIPIGGGYLVKMNKHEAVEEIKKRISSIEAAIEKLRNEFGKIGAKFREVNAKLELMRSQSAK